MSRLWKGKRSKGGKDGNKDPEAGEEYSPLRPVPATSTVRDSPNLPKVIYSETEDDYNRQPKWKRKVKKVEDDDIDYEVREDEKSRQNLAKLQAQVDDVGGIMKENISSILDRGEKLDDLQAKTEFLTVNAQKFQQTSHKIERKSRWNYQKMKIFIIVGLVVVVIIAIIIIVVIVVKSQESS